MNKRIQIILLFSAILCFPLSSIQAQSKDDKKSASKAKSYADIITAKAQSQEGLFSVHKVGLRNEQTTHFIAMVDKLEILVTLLPKQRIWEMMRSKRVIWGLKT